MSNNEKPGPMTKGPGYVFETSTLNYGGPSDSRDPGPRWMLKVSAAGIFTREDVRFIRDALSKWLEDHR